MCNLTLNRTKNVNYGPPENLGLGLVKVDSVAV